MQDLNPTACEFNPDPYWTVPLGMQRPMPYVVSDLFDQNGYDMCLIEQLYCDKNMGHAENHRKHRIALRKPWFQQEYKNEGAVLNHALLFERKGYRGEALEQLKRWAKEFPVYYKLVNIKPKWGLDLSIDYYDTDGNTFEVLHWEYDGFSYDEINSMKREMQPIFRSIDWEWGAKQLLNKKDEWYDLDFFSQSYYKSNFFGICQERYKMVVWS